ncbi:MAG: hypothetical protein R8G66_11840 [Cytophagales bacterium]|nr:hypothetical protein [Cytophagales bacterium]
MAVFISFGGCKSAKTGQDKASDPIELTEITQEKFGTSAVTAFNKKKSHALVSKVRQDKNAAFASVRFFVFDVSNGEIILEDFITQGKVDWIDNEQIRASIVAGAYQAGTSLGYIFNVETGVKTPIKN